MTFLRDFTSRLEARLPWPSRTLPGVTAVGDDDSLTRGIRTVVIDHRLATRGVCRQARCKKAIDVAGSYSINADGKNDGTRGPSWGAARNTGRKTEQDL